MALIISFSVLLFTLLIVPELKAYRLPTSNHRNSNQNSGIPVLTAQTDTYSASSNPSRESSAAIKAKISYLNALLSDQEFYGSWQDPSQQGYSILRYEESYNSYEESLDMVLCLYNGLTTNTNYSCVTFSEYVPFIPARSFNEQNMTLSFNQVSVRMGHDGRLGKECIINCSMYFTNKTTDMPFVPTYDIVMDKNAFAVQIKVQSSECGLNFVTDTMIQEDILTQNQVFNYSIAMSVAAILQCLLCHIFTVMFEKKKALCQRISQGTLRLINTFDLFISLQCFFNFRTSPLIGFTTIPYLVLAIHFEPKAIITIARAQGDLKHRGFRMLSLFNFIVFLASTITAVFGSYLQRPEWMVLIFSFHQFPQIFQNYQAQRRYRWRECLVFLFVIPKLIYAVYVVVLPQNLFKTSHTKDIAIISAVIFGFQLLILLIQKRYPTLCAKRKIVYQSFTPSEKKNVDEVCSVCLENFEANPSGSNSDALLKTKGAEERKMIMTPCSHPFHECCLRDWTKLKAICPYCRCSLPPLPEELD